MGERQRKREREGGGGRKGLAKKGGNKIAREEAAEEVRKEGEIRGRKQK